MARYQGKVSLICVSLIRRRLRLSQGLRGSRSGTNQAHAIWLPAWHPGEIYLIVTNMNCPADALLPSTTSPVHANNGSGKARERSSGHGRHAHVCRQCGAAFSFMRSPIIWQLPAHPGNRADQGLAADEFEGEVDWREGGEARLVRRLPDGQSRFSATCHLLPSTPFQSSSGEYRLNPIPS